MSRIATISRRTALVVAMGAVSALLIAAVALAAPTRNGGPIASVYTVVGRDSTSTMSKDWTDLPDMTTQVTVPDGETDLLIVTLSGESGCSESNPTPTAFCYVRLLVDGKAVGDPAQVIFDSAADGSADFDREANSMQFVVRPGPGPHRIRMQYKVDENNTTFNLDGRTLTVLRSVAQ